MGLSGSGLSGSGFRALYGVSGFGSERDRGFRASSNRHHMGVSEN